MYDDETHEPLRVLSKPELTRRLDALIAELGDSPAADAQRQLLLDLQAHQIELEMQGRELREAQTGLEVSRDHYARLFDLAPVGFVVLGRRGLIRDINLSGARMLGRPRAELVDKPFAARLQAGDKTRFLRHVDGILAGDPSVPCNDTLVVRGIDNADDGDYRTLRLLSVARRGDQGTECLSAMIDVTGEARAKAKEQRSERLRQAVLDALPAQIAVIGSDGRILAVNSAWRHFAERNAAPAEVRDGLGLDYLAACRQAKGKDAVDARLIADGIDAVLAGRTAQFVHEYPCHSPGREHWFAVTVAPLRDAADGAVVVHTDISEQKRAERDSRQAREAVAQAARVNAVGILASSLVHELTQPLTAASFFSSTAAAMMAVGKTEPAELSRVLDGVDAQIMRATTIIRRLRDFLRRREMEMKTVEIDRVVGEALGLLHWFATDHGVDIKLAQPAPGLTVQVDPIQLEQVLINLICNSIVAIDNAHEQHREVAVAIDARRDQIEVTVSDSGPGLPAESPDHLFNIFSSRRDAHLGMGLAISRDIVEAHGGKLWAEREPDEGAVFHFTLPLAAEGASA
jgi:two-component system sensor kinase FixL